MDGLKKKHYPNIGETLYQETLENGLEVYYLPKPLFNKLDGATITNLVIEIKTELEDIREQIQNIE